MDRRYEGFGFPSWCADAMSRNYWAKALVLFTIIINSNTHGGIREELLSIQPSSQLAGSGTVSSKGIESYRQILANAPISSRATFSFGKIQFNTEWDPAPGEVPANDGLGPTFNAIACASCHINNGRGRPPLFPEEELEGLLIRLSSAGVNIHGGPKPLANYGDQFQHRSIENVPSEGKVTIEYEVILGNYADGSSYELRKPKILFKELNFGLLPEDAMFSARIANPVMGLGLIEAIPESTLEAFADPEDRNNDGISGRVNRVWSSEFNQVMLGRFGWKANVATIPEQNAGAALGDMGITTIINPSDNCTLIQSSCIKAANDHADEIEFQKDFFEQLTRYVRLLGVPEQRNNKEAEIKLGEELFYSSDCAKCHIPTLKTSEDAIFPELANQTIHPYTDLLLHDMGKGLADNRPDFLATGSEWRTPPLWGIGLTEEVTGYEFYLHDGRARNLSEAILWHGGEASKAREKFVRMPSASRKTLINFIKSL
ncbi:MAG: di-heme oxidoredictase family protein [Pseudomonadota bacterium]|nr:di-heme oxidoredictase family protein [Pseudomonadota bacterium]